MFTITFTNKAARKEIVILLSLVAKLKSIYMKNLSSTHHTDKAAAPPVPTILKIFNQNSSRIAFQDLFFNYWCIWSYKVEA